MTEKNLSTKKSVKVNAVLNMLKEACSVVFPLIMFPYCFRVLQVDNLGKVTYGQSIVSYFALISALGVSTYGVREGVKYRDDRKKMDQFAAEIFTINFLSTIIAYVLLFLCVFFVPKFRTHYIVIAIFSLNVFFTAFRLEWINTVYEDFLYIMVRSIIVQLLGLVGLFAFVKKQEDYLIYAGLLVASNVIISITNIFYCRKYVSLRLTRHPNLKKHLAPMITFFSNSLAIIIYVTSDLTMLGYMCGDYYEGLYSVSAKIYQIVKQLMTAIYSVTIPRLTKCVETKDMESFRNMLTDICSVLLLLLLPASAGLITMADEIILAISGSTYIEATMSLRLLGVSLIFAVGSGILVNCINTPMGREKISLRATVLAAIINIGLNLFMIPLFRQNGAAFTTIVAEVVVFAYCLIKLGNVNEYINIKAIRSTVIQSVIGVLIIVASCLVVKKFLAGHIIACLCIGIAGSCLLYGVFLICMKNKYVMSFTGFLHRSRE